MVQDRDTVTHAGCLPVHRDQLRAQRSVTSMGSIEALACACKFSLYDYVVDKTVGKMWNCVYCVMQNAE